MLEPKKSLYKKIDETNNLSMRNAQLYGHSQELARQGAAEYRKALAEEEANKKKKEKEDWSKYTKDLQDALDKEHTEQEISRQLSEKVQAEEDAKKYTPSSKLEEQLQSTMDEKAFREYKDAQAKLDALNSKTWVGVQQDVFKAANANKLKAKANDAWYETLGKNVVNFSDTAVSAVESLVAASVSQVLPSYQFTEKEKRDKEVLERKIAAIKKPILEQGKKELQQKLDALNAKDKNADGSLLSFGINEKKSNDMARMYLQNAIELTDDAINGGGFLSVWNNDLTGDLTLGMGLLEENHRVNTLKDKIKEQGPESLTDNEKDFLDAYTSFNDVKESGINTNKAAEFGEGFKQTLKFIGEMAAVNKATKGAMAIGGATLGLAGDVTTAVGGVRGANAVAAEEALAGASKVASKVPGYISNPAIEAGRAIISPSTFGKASETYGSSIQQTNVDGETQYLATDAQKRVSVAKLDNALKFVNSKITALTSKDELTPDEQSELDMLNLKKDSYIENRDKLVDASGNILKADHSYGESLAHGAIENVKERFSEKYVGGAVDKVGDVFRPAIGSVVSKVPGGKTLVFTADKVGNAMSRGRKMMDNALFESNSLGKISKSLANHVGPAKMFHSLPAEMIEEVAVQLTPSYIGDYQKQLEELNNGDFYTNVIGTTLLLGASMGGVGTATHYGKYAANQGYRDAYKKQQSMKKDLREMYSRIDNANNDDAVAQDIAMATAGSVFQANDYAARIAELRDKNVDHKDGLTYKERLAKANYMEKQAFYNLAQNAMETGTQDEFEKTLRKLSRNTKVSEETRKNASLGINKLQEFKDIFDKHRNKKNFNTIADLSIRNNMNNEMIQELTNRVKENQVEAQIAVDQFNLNESEETKNFSLDQNVTEADQANYQDWVARFSEAHPQFDKYFEALHTIKMATAENKVIADKLAYEINPKNEKAILERENKKIADYVKQMADKNNADDARQQLVNQNLDTPTNVQAVNDAAIASANNVPSPTATTVTTPTPQRDTEYPVAMSKEDMEANFDAGFKDKSLDAAFGLGNKNNPVNEPSQEPTTKVEESVSAGDFDGMFAPIEIEDTNEDHSNIINNLKNGFSEMFKKYPHVSFENTMMNLLGHYGAVVERQFYMAAEAWNRASEQKLSKKEIDKAYEKIFGGLDIPSLVVFGNTSTATINTQPSTPVTETPATVASLTPKVIVQSLVTGDQVQVFQGRQFADTALKAGYLGLNYLDNDEGDAKNTTSTEINENAKPYLDYRNFRPGSEVELTFDYDFLRKPDNKLNQWVVLNDKLTRKTVTVKEYMEELFPGTSYKDLIETLNTNPNSLLANEEFLKIVPVGVKNNGEFNTDLDVIPGGLNDYNWFNELNVALKQDITSTPEKPVYNKTEQEQRILENRVLNLETRKQIMQNGSVKTTVEKNYSAAQNTLLLKTEEEIEQGYSNEFQSIAQAFQGNMEEAQKHSAIGVVRGNMIIGDKVGNKRGNLIKVNGKEVSTDQIVNWENFNKEVDEREGAETLGKIVMVTQSGIDEKGNPTYVIHNVITNHNKKTNEFKTIMAIRFALLDASDRLAENKGTERDLNLQKIFMDQAGLDISSKDALNQFLLDFYPEKIKTERQLDGNKNRQNYNPALAGTEEAKKLPNLMGFESVNDFLAKTLQNGLTFTTYQNVVYSNIHTQFVFTPYTNNKGETIWNSDAQNMITFSSEHVAPELKNTLSESDELNQEIARKQAALDFKMNKLLPGTTDEVARKIIEADIETLKAELTALGVAVQTKTEEINNQPVENKSSDREFDESDTFQVVQNVVFNALAKVDITEKISMEIIDKLIKEEYNSLVEGLKADGYTREAEYVESKKKEILGVGNDNYDGSVREVLDSLFDLSEDTELEDLTGENVKDYTKESYENNIADSLSLKVKLLLSGIADTRATNETNFANFQSMMPMTEALDALQQVMSNIDNNTLEDVRAAIKAKMEANSEEFAFYDTLMNRLDAINNIDSSVVNEILYNLYQPKVQMKMILFSRNADGTYKMDKFDSNSKNPQILKRTKWVENAKNSPLIVRHEEGKYTLDPAGLATYRELYKAANDNMTKENLKAFFDFIGVKLNNKTYQILFDPSHENYEELRDVVLDPKGVFKNINKNIEHAAKVTATAASKDKVAIFSFVNRGEKEVHPMNFIEFDNSRINDLVNADNAVSFMPMNMMYIAGKMINTYEQPKRISNILKRLKSDEEFQRNLRQSQITSNNFLLGLMNQDPEVTKYIDVVMTSLEALKERGTASSDKMGITNLSTKDAFVTLFNMFAYKSGEYENRELSKKGLNLRKATINFPTLSDSSQLPLFNTIVLDLQKNNVIDNTLSQPVMDIMIKQMLRGDLLRTGAFLYNVKGNTTNIKGHDAGALFIGSMPSLNTVAVDYSYEVVDKATGESKTVDTKRTLIEVFRNNEKYHTPEGVDNFIEEYKKDIEAEINSNVQHEVNQFINETGTEGLFIGNEIFKNGELQFIDNKYLESKSDVIGLERARLIAFDYVVNQMIQQKEIQTTFAGDVANYFKDNMASKLINGHAVVNTEDIIKANYKGSEKMIHQLIANEQYDQLFTAYPALKYSTEFISYNISHEEQYVANIPVLQMKMKNTFMDVQNNLSKRLKELLSPGNQFPNSRGNKSYIQLMVSDVENSSEVLEYLAETYYPGQVTAEDLTDLREFKRLDNIYEQNRTQEELDKHEALYKKLTGKFSSISGFFKTASTDAQEYVSWKDNLNQLLEQGRISEENYKNIETKLLAQEADLDSKEGKIKPENKLTKEEQKIAMMQSSKPLYSGLHFVDFGDYKAQRDVYIKSSSFAITPELAAMFPKLNYMRKAINKLQNHSSNTVVRISYDSANKVGAVKNAINISELYTDNLNPERIFSSTVELDRENFYIQQDKPYKSDKNAEKGKPDTVTRATQFEKILLGDGINQIEEHVFPNMFDTELLEEVGVEVKDGKLNGPALKAIYNKIYEKEQKLFTRELHKEIGIENFDDIKDRKPEAMEKVVKLLKKRLPNKQDRRALELVYTVEGRPGETFTKAQLEKENLTPATAEFKIPIFMTPNSRKFESVLNSTINKNSVNLTLPGFSSPVASQEGFDFKGYNGNLETLKANGLVTTKNFDPSKGLQATRTEDGKLKYAQVFIANKYKVLNNETGKYEYIDLKKFVDENGQIDTTKLPEDLLSMFSFRIPTSSHQSGVMIEVAGFLPHTVGDLMIVPKDHTVQIGEDYDIDTRYVYNYHYIQTENGSLKKLETSDLGKVKVKDAKAKVLENNLVSLYKTVFSSDSPEIQRLINQTLSTDFAENTAKEIDAKESAKGGSNNIYNIYSPITQSKIMALGADGKLGIGVHSNAVTMNSLLQQHANIDTDGNSDIKLYKGTDKDGNYINYNIQLGNMVFDGQLGRVKTPTGRRISESGMESQNSATDNQKLQIMGRRNENAETINVFAIMQATGMDNDGTEVTLDSGKKQNMSYASLFISQPIIREYVDLMKKSKSATATDSTISGKNVINTLLAKYAQGVPNDMWMKDPNGQPIVGRLSFKAKEQIGKALTSQKLYNNLVQTNDALSQLYILDAFNEMKNASGEYNKLQKFINIENGGLGVSYFDTIELMHNMLDYIRGGIKIQGAASMIGKLTNVPNDKIEEFKKEGYIFVKKDGDTNLMIKPTNHYSHKIVNSIANGYNMWSSLFPYETQSIEDQINQITELYNANDDKSPDDIKEMKYKIISSLKDYTYSSDRTLFAGNAAPHRQSLFFDNSETGHESLASYLVRLSKSDAYKEMFKLPFFRDLQFDLNEGGVASLVKYTTNDVSKLNNINMYNTLNRLVNSNKLLLDKNNKSYTEADLMRELLQYATLASQENGAIGFRQLLPMELFDKYGVADNIRSKVGGSQDIQTMVYNGPERAIETLLNSRVQEDGTIVNNGGVPVQQVAAIVKNVNARLNFENKTKNVEYASIQGNDVILNHYQGGRNNSTFVKQFLQHNPGIVPTIPYEETDMSLGQPERLTAIENITKANGFKLAGFNSGKMTSFVYKGTSDVPSPDFLVLKTKTGESFLYEKTATDYYERIPTLGGFGINEYNVAVDVKRSMITKNNFDNGYVNAPMLFEETNSFFGPQVVNGEKVEQNLQAIIQGITNDKTHPYNPLMTLIGPLVDVSGTKVTVEAGLPGNAKYVASTNTVVFSESFLANNPTRTRLGEIVIEEFLHAVTKNTMDKYVTFSGINEDGKMQYTFKQESTPASLQTLLRVYQYGLDKIIEEQGIENVKAAIEKINTLRKGEKDEKGETNDLTLEQTDIDVYRVMDVHEFIAGVFIKDKSFAKKMANTKYLESGMSILEKFAKTLGTLFNKLLPNKRTDSVSANAVSNLYEFLVSENQIRNTRRLDISTYNNAAKNKVTYDAQKLLDEAKAEENKGNEQHSPIEVSENENNNVNLSNITNKEC